MLSWFRKIQVREFSDRATRGRGFLIGGKRTVHHTSLDIENSAAVSITSGQKLFLLTALLLTALLLLLSWKAVVFTLVCVLTAFYFIDLLFGLFLAYRSFSKNPEIQVSQAELDALKETDLPTYTVFCPLYKEWRVLPQFIEAMQQLDYPKSKLQVMLQLEEDDQETVQHARAMQLPEYFHIVVVPNSKPKTKPKAMNYGLQFATGDIITIYDAEDIPEASQLKKVVVAFRKLPENVVCVQGKLNFYNPQQNMLTRMFTAEYSLWFDLILPGLQSIGAPIPLGGTSNNFKKSVLHELAGWDAYNVTEDCDLGMRLAKKGFRTAIVDSTTLEEANSGYHNWYRQRSRWIKGYMQTYLVHMRAPRKSVREFGLRNFLLLQLTVGGKVLSMFVNPLLWLVTFAYFASRTQVAPLIEPFFPPLVLYIGVVSLIFGNFFYVYAYLIGLAKRREFRVMKFVFLVPLYWLGMSVAAWKALYELIIKPHYWQKTNHGLHLAQSENERQETRDKRQENAMPVQEPVYTAPALVQELVETLQAETHVTPPALVKTPFELIPEADTVTGTRDKRQGTRFEALFSLRSFIRAQLQEIKTDSVVREGAWLVGGTMAANFFNFLFNAVLGRTLALSDFALVSLFSTILSLLAIVFSGVSAAVTHKVAFLEGKGSRGEGVLFSRATLRKTFFLAFLASLLWLVFDTAFGRFFQVDDRILIWFFAPAILFGAMAAVQGGVLRGRFAFKAYGVAGLVESIAKFVFALLFLWSGRTDLVAMSIPASLAISFVITDWYVGKMSVEKISERELVKADRYYDFPKKFFGASLLSSAAAAVFLNIDVLVAKHFLTSEDAGLYALLSLVGKMIFLFGSLLTIFVNSIVSHHEGAKADPRQAFLRLFKLTIFTSLIAYVGVGPLGFLSVPLLLGSKAAPIIPYLSVYGLGMVGFTLSTAIVAYRVARKHYSYAWVQLIVTAGMVVVLTFVHKDIWQLTFVVSSSGVASLLAIGLWRSIRENSRFILRNLTDFFDLFAPISGLATSNNPPAGGQTTSKRILVFNWRDTTHLFAGGAETYIHELARRWVQAGHEVTQFSGNDGKQPREEEIDGVRVIRRGGFYFVYVWAFFYYMFRFRGRFDLIIDCQNGVPFFTPFYAREPVYCLLHHVHQEVFHRYLPKPLAYFAAFLESKVMPFVYRDTKFITVSESSQQEMKELGLGLAGTEVIYPGVDLAVLRPGKQAAVPTVLYLGRLKAYKSVDVLIRSFKQILEKIPTARLVIAGGGEEEARLRGVSHELELCKHIEFKGKVSDKDRLLLLQQAWVFVNPSMMEGWGITTIEANACGVPVVASNVPGLRESVRNPHTGYLVTYGNEAEFAGRIVELLESPALREEMGRNALAWASGFDWELGAKKTLKLITQADS